MKALPFTEESLAQLAQVTPADIELARALWTRTVPLRWKRLLESQTLGVDPELTTPFVWDAQNRRYIELSTRRYVPFQQIRNEAIEPLIQSSKAAQRTLSAGLQSRETTLPEWQRAMLDQVKQTQVAASLASNGGDQNTSDADRKKIAALLLLLLLLLQGFAEDVAAGRQPTNGQLLVRSDLYASAARDTFEEVRRYGMAVYYGAVQERRQLGVAEHCRTDRNLEGCVELHDLGWQPINTLPRLGQTPCRTNCRCHFQYRYQDEQGNWVMVDDTRSIATLLRQLKISP